jgi:transposase
MYASVNWHYKRKHGFYNNEKDMLKPPKPLRCPIKSKYKTAAQHHQRVKDWEATKPSPLEVKSNGHHMTQEYYSIHTLPDYIQAIHEANMKEPRGWILQEDNDPSHGTKSANNVAEDLRKACWIAIIIHPGQNSDLNPIEGVWLILKQRAKKRIWYPHEAEEKWDETQKHLKSILREVWDNTSMEEIRERIEEMPSRCSELAGIGSKKLRSDTW